MQYTIEDDQLVMMATTEEREELRRLHDESPVAFDSDDFMYDLLEPLVTNDSFQWIHPGVTGDLTEAPMLGLLGDDEPGPAGVEWGHGLNQAGYWDGIALYQPVLYRWAFMDYMVTTPQRELMEHGRAVWRGGVCLEREGQMGGVTKTSVFGREPMVLSNY